MVIPYNCEIKYNLTSFFMEKSVFLFRVISSREQKYILIISLVIRDYPKCLKIFMFFRFLT